MANQFSKHGSNKAKDRCGICRAGGAGELVNESYRSADERKNNVRRKRARSNVKRQMIKDGAY